MEKRVLAAEAKRRTSIWISQSGLRVGDEKKKKKKKKMGPQAKKEIKKKNSEGADGGVGAPNINPLPVLQPPQASNHALIITSGDIGFDGRKFIFKVSVNESRRSPLAVSQNSELRSSV